MATLTRKDASTDPLDQFRSWYRKVPDSGAPEPTAVTLATCEHEIAVEAANRLDLQRAVAPLQ